MLFSFNDHGCRFESYFLARIVRVRRFKTLTKKHPHQTGIMLLVAIRDERFQLPSEIGSLGRRTIFCEHSKVMIEGIWVHVNSTQKHCCCSFISSVLITKQRYFSPFLEYWPHIDNPISIIKKRQIRFLIK